MAISGRDRKTSNGNERYGIIRNYTSPFNFPPVVVKKKNLTEEGKPKQYICVDF